MPMIKVQFDDNLVNEEDINTLCVAIQKIVSEETGIEDVFVYGNSSKIKVKVAPIEIFIEMSDHKIKDPSELVSKIKNKLSDWKTKNNFKHSINLTLIPMKWNIEIGI